MNHMLEVDMHVCVYSLHVPPVKPMVQLLQIQEVHVGPHSNAYNFAVFYLTNGHLSLMLAVDKHFYSDVILYAAHTSHRGVTALIGYSLELNTLSEQKLSRVIRVSY